MTPVWSFVLQGLGVELTIPLPSREINARVNRRAGADQAISGTRRCASASSNSPTSRMSAPSSRVRRVPSSLRVLLGCAPWPRGCRTSPTTPPAGRAVDQQAGAAEPVEVLERGQHATSGRSRSPVRLIARHLDPRRPHARAVSRSGDRGAERRSPTRRRRGAAAEHLRRPVAKRRGLLGAGAHARPRSPRRWWRCTGRTPGRPTATGRRTRPCPAGRA